MSISLPPGIRPPTRTPNSYPEQGPMPVFPSGRRGLWRRCTMPGTLNSNKDCELQLIPTWDYAPPTIKAVYRMLPSPSPPCVSADLCVGLSVSLYFLPSLSLFSPLSLWSTVPSLFPSCARIAMYTSPATSQLTQSTVLNVSFALFDFRAGLLPQASLAVLLFIFLGKNAPKICGFNLLFFYVRPNGNLTKF